MRTSRSGNHFLALLVLTVVACGDDADPSVDSGVDAGLDAGLPGPHKITDLVAHRMMVSGGRLYFGVREVGGTFILYQVDIEGGMPVAVTAEKHPVSGQDFVVTPSFLYFDGIDGRGFRMLQRINREDPSFVKNIGLLSYSYDNVVQPGGGDEVLYAGVEDLHGTVLRSSKSFDDPVTRNIDLRESFRYAGDEVGAYWITSSGTGDEIRFATHFGGAEHAIVSGQLGVDLLALDQSFVYWASSAQGYIRRASKDGLEPTILATNQGKILSLMADRGEVFYTVADGEDASKAKLWRLRAGATAPELVVADISQVFTVDAESIYFQDATSIYSLPR